MPAWPGPTLAATAVHLPAPEGFWLPTPQPVTCPGRMHAREAHPELPCTSPTPAHPEAPAAASPAGPDPPGAPHSPAVRQITALTLESEHGARHPSRHLRARDLTCSRKTAPPRTQGSFASPGPGLLSRSPISAGPISAQGPKMALLATPQPGCRVCSEPGVAGRASKGQQGSCPLREGRRGDPFLLTLL